MEADGDWRSWSRLVHAQSLGRIWCELINISVIQSGSRRARPLQSRPYRKLRAVLRFE